ncbi:MAG TPA: Ig-like domain-containing protein, partial [Flavisolibacter sp.]|nr:Ig-like domain-containing protein [Flavisolibacter sp.]
MAKSYTLSLLFSFFIAYQAFAQVNEKFSDGDFTNNPVWTGNNQDWTVNNQQLQSNNSIAGSSFYLSTPNNMATNTQWEFYSDLKFNASSFNYVDVFLTSSAIDLLASTTTGYFVRIGNTQDNVCLYRKDADGTITKLITGANGITNKSENILKIKITRSAANLFTLYCDVSGNGNNYATEGTATDNLYTSSAYFGILIHQSTSSFFQKHFFDDILIQPYVAGNTNFSLTNVYAVTASSLDLLFSAPPDIVSFSNNTSYLINNSIGNPVSVVQDATNNLLLHLGFNTSFSDNITYTISINGIKDLNGNSLVNGTANFSFSSLLQYDVIIDEI